MRVRSAYTYLCTSLLPRPTSRSPFAEPSDLSPAPPPALTPLSPPPPACRLQALESWGRPANEEVVEALLCVCEAAMHKAPSFEAAVEVFSALAELQLADSTRVYNGLLGAAGRAGRWREAQVRVRGAGCGMWGARLKWSRQQVWDCLCHFGGVVCRRHVCISALH